MLSSPVSQESRTFERNRIEHFVVEGPFDQSDCWIADDGANKRNVTAFSESRQDERIRMAVGGPTATGCVNRR